MSGEKKDFGTDDDEVRPPPTPRPARRRVAPDEAPTPRAIVPFAVWTVRLHAGVPAKRRHGHGELMTALVVTAAWPLSFPHLITQTHTQQLGRLATGMFASRGLNYNLDIQIELKPLPKRVDKLPEPDQWCVCPSRPPVYGPSPHASHPSPGQGTDEEGE